MAKFLKDTIYVIETNIDDMSPVVYESLFEKLYQKGALEIFLTPVQMKKIRPGILLTVLSPKNKLEVIAETIFRETTTFGIRYYETKRLKLARRKRIIKGKWGGVRVDEGYMARELIKVSPEYADCRRIALKKKIPLVKAIKEL